FLSPPLSTSHIFSFSSSLLHSLLFSSLLSFTTPLFPLFCPLSLFLLFNLPCPFAGVLTPNTVYLPQLTLSLALSLTLSLPHSLSLSLSLSLSSTNPHSHTPPPSPSRPLSRSLLS